MSDLTTEAAIAAIAEGLIAATLPRPCWTHAAHFAAALWMLRHRPDLATPAAFGGLIVAYNDACGTPNTDTSGFHATITIASLAVAADRLRRGPPDRPLPAVLADLMAGTPGRTDWLLRHWSRDRLSSPAARRAWLAPDLDPLPFTVPGDDGPGAAGQR